MIANEIDINLLNYHWNYFYKYYGSDFKEKQGTEIILGILNEYSVPGAWLDLGGGSNSYFWLSAMNQIREITVIDKDIEAKIVMDSIKEQKYYKGCYKYVMDMFDKSPDNVYSIPLKFIVGDLFNNSLDVYVPSCFNTITQFGLWGLLKNSDDYISKLGEACSKLAPGGVLIGANWIFEGQLITSRGYNNKYICVNLLKEFSAKSNYKLCFAEEVEVEGDPNYSRVLIYVIKEK